jgi:tetratricopeptide (TPR) repeat protein
MTYFANSSSLEKMIELAGQYPDDPIIMCGLAEAYVKNHEYKKAASLYRKVIRIRPDYPAAYGELSRVLALSRQFREAVRAIEKGIKVAEKAGEVLAVKEMKLFSKRLEKTVFIHKTVKPTHPSSLPQRDKRQ